MGNLRRSLLHAFNTQSSIWRFQRKRIFAHICSTFLHAANVGLEGCCRIKQVRASKVRGEVSQHLHPYPLG